MSVLLKSGVKYVQNSWSHCWRTVESKYVVAGKLEKQTKMQRNNKLAASYHLFPFLNLCLKAAHRSSLLPMGISNAQKVEKPTSLFFVLNCMLVSKQFVAGATGTKI